MKTKTNVADVHQEQVERINALIAGIQDAVAAQPTGEKLNWSHVGSLTHVADLLADAHNFIG